jgi:DNA end-binding protein Ku
VARGIWKGSIAFGLVEVPVVLQSAVKSNASVRFTQLDKRDMSPVGNRHYNKATGDEVAWEDVVKGYEYEKGRFVVLSEEELERAEVKGAHTIEILEFVKASDIEPVLYDTPYYVAPQHPNSRGYAILREALKKSGKVGVARVVIRTKEHVAAIFPRDGLLVLDLLRYPAEVKEPKEVEVPEQDEKALKVKDSEIEMAMRLIDGMTGKFEPKEHKDAWREAVLSLVQKKIKSGKTETVLEPETEEPREAAEVYDLMPLLEESVKKASRKGGTSVAAAERRREPAAGRTTGPARSKKRRTA